MESGLCFGIVEDNKEDFTTLCRILGPEYEVRRWQSAEQALAAFRPGGLDELAMLFLDCHLPGMDGIELAQELRNVPGGDTAKIVMLSGARDRDTALRARRAGVDRFEYKGDTLSDLKLAIGNCLAVLDVSARKAVPPAAAA